MYGQLQRLTTAPGGFAMPRGASALSMPIPTLGDPDVRDPAGRRYRGFRLNLRAFDDFRLPVQRQVAPESLTDDELIWIIQALGREGLRRGDAGKASVHLAALCSRIEGLTVK
jgi:hypothetical protein